MTQSQGTRYRCVYLYNNKSEIPVTTSISYKTASQTLVTIANRPIEQHQNVDDVIKSKEEKIIEGIACTIEGCEKGCKRGLKVHLAWHNKIKIKKPFIFTEKYYSYYNILNYFHNLNKFSYFFINWS